MRFVCWKNYKDCKAGSRYDCIDGWILDETGEKLCAEHSEDAHYHFSADDDGFGLERGPLVYKVAYVPRLRSWEAEVEDPDTHEVERVTVTGRFTPEEDRWLTMYYPSYRNNGAFNDRFCIAPIEDIRAINAYLDNNGSW